MRKFDKKLFFSSVAVLLLAIAICFRFFGEIILHPDEFLFGSSGDGMKNYFSVAYQVIHGKNLWFNGMLYPYGDHVIFADGQPLLTKVLQWVMEPDVNNGPSIIGIMNLLMIFSLVITAWCVHRLLAWNYVNPWFALPFSLAIAFLSPQVARFTGHYALGYTFFIPLSWLLIAGFSRSQWPWLVSLFASVYAFTFAFIHPYYLFIFVIFLGAILAWEFIVKGVRLRKVDHLPQRLFALIVPLVLFVVLQKVNDPYTDRPNSPSGIFDFVSTIQGVFTPVHEPIRSLFHSYFFRFFANAGWEGHAYVGLIASITGLVTLTLLIKRIRKRGVKVVSHPVLPSVLKNAFISSILILLFSMGVFHHLGLYQLSEIIAPLKQFRSLGRVAWIFFYVFSVWVVYQLYVCYRYFRSIRNGALKYHITVLMLLCTTIWALESVVNVKYHKSLMLNRNAKSSFSEEYRSDWQTAGIELESYQAILPLPLQLIGSEKIGLNQGQKSLLHSMKGSFSTGLPIIGGSMSRTSIRVTEKTANLVADSLFPRTILNDLDDGRKLLILQSHEPLNAEEQRLIKLGEKVFECADYELHSVSISAIKNAYTESASLLHRGKQGTPHYVKPKSFETNDELLWGAASYSVKEGDILLDSIFKESKSVDLSYWIKVDPNEELLPDRTYEIDKKPVELGMVGANPNLLNGWLLVSETLRVNEGEHHVYSISDRGGVVSRILIRNLDGPIIHKEDDGTVFLNNIPLL